MEGRMGEGIVREFGMDMYTLLFFKMDNQQRPAVLTQETLPNVMWQPGWEASLGQKWIHVYVWLSPFAVHLKLSQHC